MASGDALVAAQALALAGLAWPGRARWPLPLPAAAAAAAATTGGAGLAALAARAHGGRLTPRVEPPAGATLLTDGPYAVSRHPVYAGLLLAAAGVAALRRRPEPFAAWALLAVVLHLKTAREEERLLERFGAAYASYRVRTPRLLGRPRRA